MNRKYLVVLIWPLVFLATAAGSARANHIDTANATVVCSPSNGSLAVTGSALTIGDNYQVCFDIKLSPIPSGTAKDISGCVAVTNNAGSFSATIPLMGAPSGDWTVTGEIFLQDTTTGGKGTCGGGLTTLPDGECQVTVNGASSATLNCPSPNECPLTQGFWKTHPGAWPVSSLKLGTVTYTESQLITILNTPVQGDASVNLAHQLIAAKLNIANGSNPAPISSTITDADGDLDGGTIPQGVAASSTLGQDMTADASKLDNYNSSRLTPMCTGPR